MAIGVGLGMAAFTFSTAEGYWRWIKRCDEAGVDSLWQTDRLVSKEPFLECMSTMAALAGATKKVKFGMNVASMGLRDPLHLVVEHATPLRSEAAQLVEHEQPLERHLARRGGRLKYMARSHGERHGRTLSFIEGSVCAARSIASRIV